MTPDIEAILRKVLLTEVKTHPLTQEFDPFHEGWNAAVYKVSAALPAMARAVAEAVTDDYARRDQDMFVGLKARADAAEGRVTELEQSMVPQDRPEQAGEVLEGSIIITERNKNNE